MIAYNFLSTSWELKASGPMNETNSRIMYTLSPQNRKLRSYVYLRHENDISFLISHPRPHLSVVFLKFRVIKVCYSFQDNQVVFRTSYINLLEQLFPITILSNLYFCGHEKFGSLQSFQISLESGR